MQYKENMQCKENITAQGEYAEYAAKGE